MHDDLLAALLVALLAVCIASVGPTLCCEWTLLPILCFSCVMSSLYCTYICTCLYVSHIYVHVCMSVCIYHKFMAPHVLLMHHVFLKLHICPHPKRPANACEETY
jgi:hypothetical protein